MTRLETVRPVADAPVADALELLKIVGDAGCDVSVDDLSGLADMPADMVSACLATFEEAGFLRRDPDQGTYVPSLTMWRLAPRPE